MAKVSSPPSPKIGDAVGLVGAPILITETIAGSAQAVWEVTAEGLDWEHVFLSVGTIHIETVKLSVCLGGVDLGEIFEQDIPPRSGRNIVLDWEPFRAGLGSIYVFASVANVLNVLVYSSIRKAV